MERVTVTISPRQADALRADAEMRGISLSEAMRRALDAWIDVRLPHLSYSKPEN